MALTGTMRGSSWLWPCRSFSFSCWDAGLCCTARFRPSDRSAKRSQEKVFHFRLRSRIKAGAGVLTAWIHVPLEGLLSAKSANLIVLSARYLTRLPEKLEPE